MKLTKVEIKLILDSCRRVVERNYQTKSAEILLAKDSITIEDMNLIDDVLGLWFWSEGRFSLEEIEERSNKTYVNIYKKYLSVD